MPQNMIANRVTPRFIDKRRLLLAPGADGASRTTGITLFTCNATGTVNTAVGANAAPGTNDNNVIRRGESFKIYNSSGAAKEETIFRVTSIAVAGSTTVTYSPASAVAPVSGDILRRVGQDQMDDIADLDFRLNQLDSTTFTQAKLDSMTPNDKIYAMRVLGDDKDSLP